MKKLKLKSILFSLFAVAMISVLLISCEKNVSVNELPDISENQTSKEYNLPFGYNELSEKEIEEYLLNLDADLVDLLVESRRVVLYFNSIDKQDMLIENATFGEIFDATTISKYLSEEDVTAFETFVPTENLEARWCCDSWKYNNTWYHPVGSGCFKHVTYTRNCSDHWICSLQNEYRDDVTFRATSCPF